MKLTYTKTHENGEHRMLCNETGLAVVWADENHNEGADSCARMFLSLAQPEEEPKPFQFPWFNCSPTSVFRMLFGRHDWGAPERIVWSAMTEAIMGKPRPANARPMQTCLRCQHYRYVNPDGTTL